MTPVIYAAHRWIEHYLGAEDAAIMKKNAMKNE
jgi:hypothetical protein